MNSKNVVFVLFFILTISFGNGIKFKIFQKLDNEGISPKMLQLLGKAAVMRCGYREEKKKEEKVCATTLNGGNDVIKRENTDSRTNFYVLDKNRAINQDGEVTSFKIYADQILPLQLIIYRDNSEWSIIGKSQMVTPKILGVNEFVLEKPINVKKGDFIGIYFPEAGCVSMGRKSNLETWDLGYLGGKVLFTRSGSGPNRFFGSGNLLYSISVSGVNCDTPSDQSNSTSTEGTKQIESDNCLVGGNELSKRETPDSRTNFYLVDQNNPINQSGEVKTFKIFADQILPLQLLIYRKTSGWEIVGRSHTQTPTKLGINEFVLENPITVNKGDFIGIFYPKGGSVSFGRHSNSEMWDLGNLSGKVLFTNTGAGPTQFSGSSNRIYSISVSDGKCRSTK